MFPLVVPTLSQIGLVAISAMGCIPEFAIAQARAWKSSERTLALSMSFGEHHLVWPREVEIC